MLVPVDVAVVTGTSLVQLVRLSIPFLLNDTTFSMLIFPEPSNRKTAINVFSPIPIYIIRFPPVISLFLTHDVKLDVVGILVDRDVIGVVISFPSRLYTFMDPPLFTIKLPFRISKNSLEFI